MVQYATPTELAGALQKDLDTYSANQALDRATERFARRARSRWAATAGSFITSATFATSISIPARQVTAVTAIKVNGTPIAVDYTFRLGRVYRLSGFGNPVAWPPDEITIEYTYGYTAVTDDVKDAVLTLAAAIYQHPDSAVVAETIDDYSVRFDGNAITLSGKDWREVADHYAGLLVA